MNTQKIIAVLDTRINSLNNINVAKASMYDINEAAKEAQRLDDIRTTMTHRLVNQGWSDEEIILKTVEYYKQKMDMYKTNLEIHASKNAEINLKEVQMYNDALLLLKECRKYILTEQLVEMQYA